jgi:hypothetical protein
VLIEKVLLFDFKPSAQQESGRSFTAICVGLHLDDHRAAGVPIKLQQTKYKPDPSKRRMIRMASREERRKKPE